MKQYLEGKERYFILLFIRFNLIYTKINHRSSVSLFVTIIIFQLSDGTNADKSKKKKRLDDIMFGLGASKGLALGKDKEDASASKTVSPGQSLLKKVTDGKSGSELNNLQDLLGPPGSPADAKVQKWL